MSRGEGMSFGVFELEHAHSKDTGNEHGKDSVVVMNAKAKAATTT